MELKPLSCLVFVLLLSVGSLQPASAKDASGSAVAASKPGIAARAGATEKVDVNWERDLFAIFREGSGAGKSASATGAPVVKKIALLKEEPVVRKSEPVVLEPKKLVVPRELKLQGIVFSDEESATALVDGKIVRQGEEVAGWRVSRITKRGILLEDRLGKREYELLAGSEKSMVSSSPVVVTE